MVVWCRVLAMAWMAATIAWATPFDPAIAADPKAKSKMWKSMWLAFRRPIHIEVRISKENASLIGLTSKAIREAVELALRRNNVPVKQAEYVVRQPTLLVYILSVSDQEGSVSSAINITVVYPHSGYVYSPLLNKNPLEERSFAIIVWTNGAIAASSTWSAKENIVDALSRLIDKFSLLYHRAKDDYAGSLDERYDLLGRHVERLFQKQRDQE